MLIVGGVIPIESASPDVAPPEALVQQVTTPPEGVTIERVTTAETTPKAADPTLVVLSAVHGDSWFSARVGSESGRVPDERVLAQGETVRVRAERIWLSVGASANLEVTVNGEPTELSPGTGGPTRVERQLRQRRFDRLLRRAAIRALDRAGEPHEAVIGTN